MKERLQHFFPRAPLCDTTSVSGWQRTTLESRKWAKRLTQPQWYSWEGRCRSFLWSLGCRALSDVTESKSDSPNEQRGPSSSLSAAGTLFETWLEERNTAGAFILLLSFGFKLVSCGNFRFMEKLQIYPGESPYAPSPTLKFANHDIFVKTKNHICVLLSTEFQTWFRFLRLFPEFSLYAPHSTRIIFNHHGPLSFPIHDLCLSCA